MVVVKSVSVCHDSRNRSIIWPIFIGWVIVSACEVEFSDKNGKMYDSLGLQSEQSMVLIYESAFT